MFMEGPGNAQNIVINLVSHLAGTGSLNQQGQNCQYKHLHILGRTVIPARQVLVLGCKSEEILRLEKLWILKFVSPGAAILVNGKLREKLWLVKMMIILTSIYIILIVLLYAIRPIVHCQNRSFCGCCIMVSCHHLKCIKQRVGNFTIFQTIL